MSHDLRCQLIGLFLEIMLAPNVSPNKLNASVAKIRDHLVGTKTLLSRYHFYFRTNHWLSIINEHHSIVTLNAAMFSIKYGPMIPPSCKTNFSGCIWTWRTSCGLFSLTETQLVYVGIQPEMSFFTKDNFAIKKQINFKLL